MISVREAVTAAELDEVRKLMRAFIAWHRERHVEDRQMVDAYFDPLKFEEELAALPGEFAPPSGRLLLAWDEGAVAGCVGLRRLEDGLCEMKRMFVYPAFHGRGIGMALGHGIIEEAKAIGYSVMRLDTGARQDEAKGLYRKLGFREIRAYYDVAKPMREWLTFMELELG